MDHSRDIQKINKPSAPVDFRAAYDMAIARFVGSKACPPNAAPHQKSNQRERRGRSRNKFRQRDLRTAVKTARDAGLEIERVEIWCDGKIVIVTGKSPPVDELDRELAKFVESVNAR